MPTVILEQAEVRLSIDQLLTVIRQLPVEEREVVRRALETDQWEPRFDALLQRVRSRAEAVPITDGEITEEVEKTRVDRYAQGGN
jgi:hypothetical protein